MLSVVGATLVRRAELARPHRPLVRRAEVPARMQLISPIPGLPDHLQEMHAAVVSGSAQLFDVREPREHAMGMLACAEAVPLSVLESGSVSPGFLDKDKLTYLHCAAGVRVWPASDILRQMGFERVVPLQEGFATLSELGFPLEEEDD